MERGKEGVLVGGSGVYPLIQSMSVSQVDKAEEYMRVYGVTEALYIAVQEGLDKCVVQYLHEAGNFDDEALEDIAIDYDIAVSAIKQEFLLK